MKKLFFSIALISAVTKFSSGQSQTFDYTGSDQTYTVPAGVSCVFVKMWGAGGGSGDNSNSGNGGGAAYVSGTLSVTPGEDLTVIVGQGGLRGVSNADGSSGYPNPSAYGGGGRGRADNRGGGGGGGRSAIRRGATELATASGGGGGAGSGSNVGNGTNYCGGAGGGVAGNGTQGGDRAGCARNPGGRGATPTAGGTGGGGGPDGTAFTGGSGENRNDTYGGGGGGGGYFGGEGGATSGNNSGGGGGGSSYFSGTLAASNAGTSGGTGGNTTVAAGNWADADNGSAYGGGGGRGSSTSANTGNSGQNGRIVITPLSANASRLAPTGPQCSGTTLNFTSSPLPASAAVSSYSWVVTPPVSSTATPSTGNAANFSFTPVNNSGANQTFTVTLTVTFTSGCTATATFSPTIYPTPNPGAIQYNGTTQNICPGATITSNNITATSSGYGTLVTVWYAGEEISPGVYGNWRESTLGNISATTSSVNLNTAAGGGTGQGLTLTNYNPQSDFPSNTRFWIIRRAYISECGVCQAGCFDQSFYLNITPNNAITSATATTSPICPSTTTTITANGVSGTNAVLTWWTGSGGTGTNLGSANPLTVGPGTYYARVTGDCGPAVEASVVVASNSNAAITSATATASPICPSATTTITANGVAGTSAILTWWTGSGGTGTNLGSANPLTDGPGTYYARVTASCGAPVEALVTVAAYSNPSASAVANNNTNCIAPFNGSVDLTTSGTSYSWSNGAITEDLSALNAGTYTVTVTDANSCTATASATVINTTSSPSASAAASNNTNCIAPFNGSVDLTTSATSFLWSNGAVTEDLSAVNAGTYIVTVTDGGGCTATASATVNNSTVNPSASAVANDNTNCIAPFNGSVNLTTSATSYLWSNGAVTEDLLALNAGTYTVTVTAANGCTASTSANVTENTLPTPGISGSLSYCAGQNTTLTASGGTSYAWSNGDATAATTVTQGSYTVTVTNANNCTASTSTNVTENALPTPGISGSLTYCTGQNTTLTASGGTSYLWSNGDATAATTVTQGSYTVTVTNAANCTAFTSANVTENALPAPAISGNLSYCAGQNTTLTASGGTGYLWSNSANTAANTVTQGSYSVTVTGANSCTASTSANVTENTLPTPGISGSLSYCAGQNTTLTASGGTSYLWSNGDATSATTVTQGSYTVTVTNAYNCTASTSTNVKENALPTPAISGSLSYCAGQNTTLTASGGTGYLWSNGDATAATTVTQGSYTVTVTNADGCKTTDSIRVDIINAKIIQNDTAICLGDSIRLYADTSNNVNQICSLNDLSQNLRNGLVSFYPFCGNANDISGNGNNGTVNGATLCPDRANKPDAAYSFNGTNNTINYSQPFLNGTQVSEFTMRAVVKFNSTSNSPNIWGKTLFWGEVNFLVANTNVIELWWANSLTGNKYSSIYSNTNVIQAGLWYDIVVVYKNSSGQIYVNGTPITTNLDWTAQGGSLLSTTQIESRCNFAQDANSSKIGLRTSGGNPGNYLNGFLDEFDIWNRALSPTEIAQLDPISAKYISGGASYIWSTGDTTASILVSPSQSTSYNLVVTQNGNSCSDSVRVSVSRPTVSLGTDTIVCGESLNLNAAGSNSSYNWNTGDTTSNINVTSSGLYAVTVTNADGCKATDSIRVNIINAQIMQNDTTICLGDSVKLSADTSNNVNQICSINNLPQNLRNGLVGFWPFCGNANDESGNGNNGTVNGATLTTDRFGNTDAGYIFDGVDDFIETNLSSYLNGSGAVTISYWISTPLNFPNNPIGNFGTTIGHWKHNGQFNGPIGIQSSHFSDGRVSISLIGSQGAFSATNVISQNTWLNVIIVYNGISPQNQRVALYIDGVFSQFINVTNAPSALGTEATRTHFGAASGTNPSNPNLSAWSFFNGKLDDIGIWNRVLTQQEITALYTLGSSEYLWSTGDTTASITVSPTQTTSYNLTVTNNGYSCTDSIRVGVSQPVVLINAVDSIFCAGDSVLLTASGASTYSWTNGVNAPATYANQTMTYTVIGTDSLGCRDSSSINTLIADTLTWNGSEDTDWHKGCNWSPAKVPACCNSVVVPLTSNQPIVTGVAGCKDITIHSTNGARLQVNNGANLQIEQCPSPPIRNGCN